MSTWYAQIDGDWSNAASLWNDAVDGSGNYGSPADGDTDDLNGHAVTLGADPGGGSGTFNVVDGSGGEGRLILSGNWTLGCTLQCYCTVHVLTNPTITVTGTLQLVIVSAECGGLDVSGGGALVFNGGTLDCSYAGSGGVSLPIVIHVATTMMMFYDPQMAGNITPGITVINASVVFTVSGTLYWFTAAFSEVTINVGPGGQLVAVDAGGNMLGVQGASITLPAVGNVMYGVDRGDGQLGTHTDPNTDGQTPNAALVLNTAHFGAGNATAGTYTPGTIPAASDVRQGVAVGSTTGTCYVPSASDVTARYQRGRHHGDLLRAHGGADALWNQRGRHDRDGDSAQHRRPHARCQPGIDHGPLRRGQRHGRHLRPGTIPAAGDVRHGTPSAVPRVLPTSQPRADVRHGTNVDATTGTCYVPTAAQTLYGINVDATTGTVTLPNTDGHTPDASQVLTTAHFGAGNATAGTYVPGTIPAAGDVRHGTAVGSSTGTAYIPAAADVRYGTNVDATTGTCYVPTAAQTLYGINVDATTGTVTLPNTDGHTPDASQVLTTAHFGAGNATAGTYVPGTIPAAGDVRHGTAVGSSTGTAYIPAAADVRYGTNVDATTGTCYVPTAAQTLYGINVDATTGTVTLPNTDGSTPNAALVLNTAHFGAANATAGTYDPDAAVYPPVAYVHSDAGTYGPTGVEYTPGLSALANWTLIAGVALPDSVLLGVPVYSGGPNGTYSGYNMGGLTPAQAAAIAAAYESQTNSGPNTTLDPMLANGDISLVAGNDYNATLDNLVEIDASQWPDLTGATVKLQFELASTGAPDGLPAMGEIVAAGTDDQVVEFSLPHVFTAALQAGLGGAGFHNHTYTVTATWTATKNTWSPPRGSASVYVA